MPELVSFCAFRFLWSLTPSARTFFFGLMAVRVVLETTKTITGDIKSATSWVAYDSPRSAGRSNVGRDGRSLPLMSPSMTDAFRGLPWPRRYDRRRGSRPTKALEKKIEKDRRFQGPKCRVSPPRFSPPPTNGARDSIMTLSSFIFSLNLAFFVSR